MNPPTDKILYLLLAEFGTAKIPIGGCAHHFGLTEREARRAAARQLLPVPCYRLGSQKSPWLVSADALAAYIRRKQSEAEADWKRIHCAA